MKITDAIQGKTVDVMLTDGKDLIIRCTDGHEYVVGFDNGPYLKGINARIVLPVPIGAVSAVGF